MNFFKKLFGVKNKGPKDIHGIKKDLSDCLANLDKSLGEINTLEIPKKNKKLHLIVKNARSQFTVKLRENLKKIQINKENDYESLKKLHSDLALIISGLSKRNLRNDYFLDFMFRKQMNKIGMNIQSFVDCTNELFMYLKAVEKKRAPIERKKSLEKNIKLLEKEKIEFRKKLSDLIKNKKIKENKILELKQDMKNTKSGVSEKIHALSNTKQDIDSKIFGLVNPVKRALKKYEKQAVFEKRTGKILDDYIKNPIRASHRDTKQEIGTILTDLLKLVDSNELVLKQNIKDNVKVLNENLDDIQSSLKEIEEINTELEHLNNILNTENNKIKDINTELKSLTFSVEKIDSELSYIEKKLSEIDNNLKNFNEELIELQNLSK